MADAVLQPAVATAAGQRRDSVKVYDCSGVVCTSVRHRWAALRHGQLDGVKVLQLQLHLSDRHSEADVLTGRD